MTRMTEYMMVGMGGLFMCVTVWQGFKRKVSDQIKGTNVYKEAMEILRESKGALHLLGEPITDSVAKYNSPGEAFGAETEVKVPVSGPKSSGLLFFKVISDEQNNKSLGTVQLQIGKDDSKRLVIKKSINEESKAS